MTARPRLWSDRQPADRLEPFNLLNRNQMMEDEPPPDGSAGRWCWIRC
jgi:hypothetical protein